jgi:hypothetical protein
VLGGKTSRHPYDVIIIDDRAYLLQDQHRASRARARMRQKMRAGGGAISRQDTAIIKLTEGSDFQRVHHRHDETAAWEMRSMLDTGVDGDHETVT